MADNDSGIAFVSGFLLGGVLGAAVGMLLAPKSGAETRADIAERSDVWRQRAEEMAAQINESIAPTVESVRQQVTPAVDVVRERMGMEPLADTMEAADADGTGPAVVEEADRAMASDSGETGADMPMEPDSGETGADMPMKPDSGETTADEGTRPPAT